MELYKITSHIDDEPITSVAVINKGLEKHLKSQTTEYQTMVKISDNEYKLVFNDDSLGAGVFLIYKVEKINFLGYLSHKISRCLRYLGLKFKCCLISPIEYRIKGYILVRNGWIEKPGIAGFKHYWNGRTHEGIPVVCGVTMAWEIYKNKSK